MKIISFLFLTLVVQSAHAIQPNDDRRWLTCLVSGMGQGAPGDAFVLPLKTVTSEQVEACKQDKFCGADQNNYLVQGDANRKHPTFQFGRYDILVDVLVDNSISDVQVVDQKKGISMSLMSPMIRVSEYGDDNLTDGGHSFEIYIYQKEANLASYDISCSVYKERDAKDLGDVGKKIRAILKIAD